MRRTEVGRAYKRAALALFGAERDDIATVVRGALARGGGLPVVEASLRAVERALTTEKGEYHVKWLERFTALNRTTQGIAYRELKLATGLDFLMENRIASFQARVRARQLADFVGEATSARVTDVVRTAFLEGGSTADIVEALRDRAFGEELSLARAERIARTETGTNLNSGQYEQAKDAGVFAAKEWLHSGNVNAPRDWHAAMDGERVGIEDRFSNGLLFPLEPGAPPEEVINCGCTALYHV